MSMLKIVVVGAGGRMGRLIAKLALADSALTLAGVVDRAEKLGELPDFGCVAAAFLEEILDKVPDAVVIDFTAPQVALNSARIAAAKHVALVIGTTGFDDGQKAELATLAAQAPLLWSANMSVGVNVLMRLLPELVRALGPAYDMEMMEIHHRKKKDAPSGTALMLGEALAKARGWELAKTRQSCRDGIIGQRPDEEIGIMAMRGGDVVGVHTVYFMGPGEVIEVKHQAQSRENFAQGALRAARWLAAQKPGRLYSMQDVIAEDNS